MQLTGDTCITSFSGTAANFKTNGYTLYVNGIALSGIDTADIDTDTDNDEKIIGNLDSDEKITS